MLLLNLEIVNALERIEGEEPIPDTRKMVYKEHNKTFNFVKFKTRSAFGNAINAIITIYIANDKQNQLSKSIRNHPTATWKKKKKTINSGKVKEGNVVQSI